MPKSLLIALVGLILSATAAMVAPPRASADSLLARSISWTQPSPHLEGHEVRVEARFYTSSKWRRTAVRSRQQRFSSGDRDCRYALTVRTGFAYDGEPPRGSARERAESQLPATSAYEMLQGARDSAAVRVIRVKRSDGRVQLRAIHTIKRNFGQIGAWQDTTVSALSGKGDECHAGSYRSLARQIGDTLLTVTGKLSHYPKS